MVTIQLVLGRDTPTPISIVIQEESAAVAAHGLEIVMNKYVQIALDDDDEDDGGTDVNFN